jgi:hypothetical protein
VPREVAGKPRRLFAGDYVKTFGGGVRAQYDVSPDGGLFLMLKPVEHEETPLTQINWCSTCRKS